jgi:hypothetical protein
MQRQNGSGRFGRAVSLSIQATEEGGAGETNYKSNFSESTTGFYQRATVRKPRAIFPDDFLVR